VEIVEKGFFDQKKENIDQEDIEWAIAHEISHGFLCYKKSTTSLNLSLFFYPLN